MWRSIIIALALICLVLLGWYAVRKYPGRIEASIQSRAQKVLDQKVPGVIVKVSQRDAVLAGHVATDADKRLAEETVAGLSGVKSVTSQIGLGQPVPEASVEAPLALELTSTGTIVFISGEAPAAVLDKITSELAVGKLQPSGETHSSGGTVPALSVARGVAAVQALQLLADGSAKLDQRGLRVVGTAPDAATADKVKAIVDAVQGTTKLTVKESPSTDVTEAPADAAVADAGPADTTEVAQPDTAIEVAAADTAPATPEVVQPAPVPGGALSAADCKTQIQALIEGEQRITFQPNTGKLTPEGDAKVQQIVGLLQRCPTAKGRIEGYHDDYGEPDKLKFLTQARAYNVHKRIVELGVDGKRFTYIGLGYRNMRYGAKQRVLNQRVEFNISVE